MTWKSVQVRAPEQCDIEQELLCPIQSGSEAEKWSFRGYVTFLNELFLFLVQLNSLTYRLSSDASTSCLQRANVDEPEVTTQFT